VYGTACVLLLRNRLRTPLLFACCACERASVRACVRVHVSLVCDVAVCVFSARWQALERVRGKKEAEQLFLEALNKLMG
jgi:hypothetical protein